MHASKGKITCIWLEQLKRSKLDSELLVLVLLAVSSCIIIKQNTIRFGKVREVRRSADQQIYKISAPFIRKTHSASQFKFGTE